jgi:2-amino-4-hydroxy-6-hydroxymethyldihydropteridine diphosphokinase
MGANVVVGLGANLGDAVATLAAAVREIAALDGVEVLAVSAAYRTAPVGGPEQPDYHNAAVLLDVARAPLELLRELQAIELGHGRERLVRWGPRTLDLDVLLWGEEAVELPDLAIPHPRLVERRFALEPLLDVAPDAVLPGGRRLDGVLAALPEQGVERLAAATIEIDPPPDRG